VSDVVSQDQKYLSVLEKSFYVPLQVKDSVRMDYRSMTPNLEFISPASDYPATLGASIDVYAQPPDPTTNISPAIFAVIRYRQNLNEGPQRFTTINEELFNASILSISNSDDIAQPGQSIMNNYTPAGLPTVYDFKIDREDHSRGVDDGEPVRNVMVIPGETPPTQSSMYKSQMPFYKSAHSGLWLPLHVSRTAKDAPLDITKALVETAYDNVA
jgi:hypothetical protein